MSFDSQHISWLIDTGEILATNDGNNIKVYEFNHEQDEEILSSWAKHFRNHYCSDEELEALIADTGYSKKEYLNNIKFPDLTGFGPRIRAGDFAEILVADYLEYTVGYWVPRTRWSNKTIKNESVKGIDLIGFKLIGSDENPNDALITFEVKAKLKTRNNESTLQKAINDSIKDEARKAESLNAIRQRLLYHGKLEEVKKVGRFQNQTDKPYKNLSGAAAVIDNIFCEQDLAIETSTVDHNNSSNISLVVIKGESLMDLVHLLYERAANEA